MKFFIFIFMTSLLCSCATPVIVAPQLFLPDFATSKVKVETRALNLTRKKVDSIKNAVTKEESKLFNDVLYNYFHYQYSLDACNVKLSALHDYLGFFQQNTTGIEL